MRALQLPEHVLQRQFGKNNPQCAWRAGCKVRTCVRPIYGGPVPTVLYFTGNYSQVDDYINEG